MDLLLFGDRPSLEGAPAGLVYEPDFLDEREERRALAVVEQLDFEEVRMRGETARRTVRHFGRRYGYDSWRLVAADPLPEALEWLRERSAELAGVEPAYLVEVLVSRYPEGAGIGWHRDAPAFGDPIVGVSLAAPARMRFRRTDEYARRRFALELAPRSAYVLAGEARWEWQHSIPSAPALRYSVTFRALRAGPR